MRWRQESAITIRDDSLARIRRLSAWIAGGATATSFGLAAALGFALPGHSYHTGRPVSPPGQSKQGKPAVGNQGNAPRTQPPAGPVAPPVAPPVVTSGGS